MFKLRTSANRRFAFRRNRVSDSYVFLKDKGHHIDLRLYFTRSYIQIFVNGINEEDYPEDEKMLFIDLDDFKNMDKEEAVDMIAEKTDEMASKFGLSVDDEFRNRIVEAVEAMTGGAFDYLSRRRAFRRFAKAPKYAVSIKNMRTGYYILLGGTKSEMNKAIKMLKDIKDFEDSYVDGESDIEEYNITYEFMVNDLFDIFKAVDDTDEISYRDFLDGIYTDSNGDKYIILDSFDLYL